MVPVMEIVQAGAAIGGTLIKGINALVDARSTKSFNNALKMVAANVELTHQRLQTLENRTSMIAKAIMPVLDVLKGRIADTNQTLTSQYRMMQMAHHGFTFQTDTRDTHNTSFCLTTFQELFNDLSRYVTKNTSSV